MEEDKSGDGDSYTNVKHVYDSNDEMWAENRSKILDDPLLMKKKNVVEQKKKTEENRCIAYSVSLMHSTFRFMNVHLL